jgi:hypothetical protein
MKQAPDHATFFLYLTQLLLNRQDITLFGLHNKISIASQSHHILQLTDWNSFDILEYSLFIKHQPVMLAAI